MQFSVRMLWFGLKRECLADWRSLFILAGVFVFLCTVSYMAYFFLAEKTPMTWLFFYWTVFLLLGIQLAGGAFVKGNQEQKIYWYCMIHPLQFFVIKCLYQSLVLTLFTTCLFFIFWTLSPLESLYLYHWVILIPVASFAIACIFTITSLISTSTDQHNTMILVISLPLVIPVMGMLMTIGSKAMTNPGFSWYGQYLILAAIMLITVALGLLLIPIIWRS